MFFCFFLFFLFVFLDQVIERNVETVQTEQKDKRQDLYAMAYSYCGQLRNKKSVMIPESEFHVVTKRPVKSSPPPPLPFSIDRSIVVGLDILVCITDCQTGGRCGRFQSSAGAPR